MNWTADDIKPQIGKSFLITGANTGLGFETALALAKNQATVILAGRSEGKLVAARDRIAADVPDANLDIAVLDLNSIASITAFAQTYSTKHTSLDVLINNAGNMFPPAGKTEDGFETQFGVNFIGHYVLTALLFPLLKNSPHGRIVTLSSIAHLNGKIDFDNLKLEKTFDKFREYGQSKLADLIFALELHRKIEKNNLQLVSVACHPGVSKTELLRYDAPDMINTVAYMEANQGALPTLYAATQALSSGSYIGPDGENEINGFPAPAKIDAYAKDERIGRSLWEYAENESNTVFNFDSPMT